MLRLGIWPVATLVFCVICLALIALFNYALDPFHLFRADKLYVKEIDHQRYVNAGIIRTERDFDALVIGNSYIANFNTEVIDAQFGTRSRVISAYGASAQSIATMLRFALAQRSDLKLVFFGLPIWDVCGSLEDPQLPLPRRLYSGDPYGFLQVLLAKETTSVALAKTMLVLHLGKPTTLFTDDVREVPRWDRERQDLYGAADHLQTLLGPIPLESRSPNEAIERAARDLLNCFDRGPVTIARAFPSVRFYVFNPPMYQWLLWLREREGLVPIWNRAQELFGEAAANLPNLEYHDFLAAAAIVNDCRRFRDLAHFDPASGDEIVAALKAGTYRRTPARDAMLSARIASNARERVQCPPQARELDAF